MHFTSCVLVILLHIESGLQLSSSKKITNDNSNPLRKRTQIQLLSTDEIAVFELGVFSIGCAVTEHLRPPRSFAWIHNGTEVDLGKHRSPLGGISVQNWMGEKSSTSRLTIIKAGFADGGVYTCRPIGLPYAHEVEVIRDKVFVKVMQEPRPFYYSSSEVKSLNCITMLTSFLCWLNK